MQTTHTDALGRAIHLAAPPRRIVSLVPSLTELLADLGLDAEVVGLTKFCVHPADWRARKAVVGGTRNARFDDIVALRPDLVLCAKEENDRGMVERLAEQAPVYVTDVVDLAGALAMIRAVGALVDRGDAAAALADEIEGAFAGLDALPLQRVAYLIWKGPYMAAGGGTFIDAMLRAGGFANAFGARARYPEVEVAELRAAGLDRLLLSSEPFPFDTRHVAELAEALPGVRVQCVPGEPFSWYGSRLLETPGAIEAVRGGS